MKFITAFPALLTVALLSLLAAAPAQAQATRTWVSGVGDDANPCSRTAPCKTFAGSISKTATGGEINCLDPGGFGTLTITKSITINCKMGPNEGGVLSASVNGFIINADPSSDVVLRGIDIEGTGTGNAGVNFIHGGVLHIQDSAIRGSRTGNATGIIFQPDGASSLFVSDTVISGNGTGAGTGGIVVSPRGGTGSALAILDNVNIESNGGSGILLDSSGGGSAVRVIVQNSLIAGNTIAGVNAIAFSSATNVLLKNVTTSNNGTGIISNGSLANVKFGSSAVTGNSVAFSSVGGGSLVSYGNNQVDLNSSIGSTPTQGALQ